MRTLQALAQKDMTVNGKYTNAWYSGAVDLHGSTDAIWHTYMIACFDNTGVCAGKSDKFRKYILNKGCIGIVMGYATYEMGAALWKAADGSTSDVGAPYAWDEAAAFFIGNIVASSGDGYTGKAPGNLYSPYEFAWKRDTDFPQGTSMHTASVPIFNYGLINCRGSDYNAANLAAAQLGIYKIIAVTAIRSAIKYSWKAYNNGTFKDYYLAEGWAYWRTGSGYIASLISTTKATVQQIDTLLDFSLTDVPATTPCTIKTHLESMYQAIGISCAIVGEWKDAEGCLATACDDTGNTNTLMSGSTAYVDMCQDVSSADTSGVPRFAGTTFPALTAAALAATCDFA